MSKRNEIPIDLGGFATDPNVIRMLEIFDRLEKIAVLDAALDTRRDGWIHRVKKKAARIRWRNEAMRRKAA